MKFFDRLVPFLQHKEDLPKAIIVKIIKMIHKVKDLNTFINGKLHEIQNKMKTIDVGLPNFVSTILYGEGKLKDCVQWSSSFDNILDHSRFSSYCNNETSITKIYDMIDMHIFVSGFDCVEIFTINVSNHTT